MDRETTISWVCVALIVVSVMAMIVIATVELNRTKRCAFENGYERADYKPTLGSGWYKAGTERSITIGGKGGE